MKLLYASLYPLLSKASTGAGGYVRIYTDGSILRVTFETRYLIGANNQIFFDVTYNGVTQRSAVLKNSQPECPSVSLDFTYDDSVKSVTFASPNTSYSGQWYDLYYNGVLLDSKTYTVSWKGSADDPSNVSGYIKSKTGAFYNQTNKVKIGVTKPATYVVRIMRLTARYYTNSSITVPYVHEIAENIAYSEEYTHTGKNYIGGRGMWYSLMLGFYDGEVDPSVEPENFVEYLELTSPVYIGFTASQVPPPLNLSYGAPAAGGKNKITWDLSEAEVAQVIIQTALERSTDGGSTWTQIYKDEGTSFSDTVGSDWESVMYRARTYSASSYSNYVTGEEVFITHTNLFIGNGGVPVAVSGLYLGKDGLPVSISPIMYVGG